MEGKDSQRRKPFVEPNLIKGEKIYEVTFQAYAPLASTHHHHHPSYPFSSTFLFPMPHRKR